MPVPTRRDLSGVQPSLRGKRVLVVDDNATNRRILAAHLDAWGMLARATEFPAEALAWIRANEAVFGAPLPHADHRNRAVRAALEMIDLMEGFNRERVRQGAMEIRIGIGIASGAVIAGFTGTQQRVTYTCVGDTVNLAAHLEAHTKVVGQPILIDEATRAGLGNAIRAESHGATQFKTRSQAAQVYSVPPGQQT